MILLTWTNFFSHFLWKKFVKFPSGIKNRTFKKKDSPFRPVFFDKLSLQMIKMCVHLTKQFFLSAVNWSSDFICFFIFAFFHFLPCEIMKMHIFSSFFRLKFYNFYKTEILEFSGPFLHFEIFWKPFTIFFCRSMNSRKKQIFFENIRKRSRSIQKWPKFVCVNTLSHDMLFEIQWIRCLFEIIPFSFHVLIFQ